MSHERFGVRALFAFLFGLTILSARQQWSPLADRHGERPDGPGPSRLPPPPMRRNRSPLEGIFYSASPGRWWTDPWAAQRIGLTADQQKKMDAVFQQSRLRLIGLNASLQKEEAILEPLLQPDSPDESKILVQIDRIAQARAELEKANARLLLGLRTILTSDQWQKLISEHQEPHNHR